MLKRNVQVGYVYSADFVRSSKITLLCTEPQGILRLLSYRNISVMTDSPFEKNKCLYRIVNLLSFVKVVDI